MTEPDFEQMRRHMVASQLRTTGVNDPRVLAAMGAVAREDFVPVERRAAAYADIMLPLGEGRALSPPMTLGLLLTEARLAGDERALLVGAAGGYSAAVLVRLVGSLVAIEEAPALVAKARAALAPLGVELVEAPLETGHATGGPYDFILVDGAIEELPPAIIDQLADGGRAAFVLLDRGVTRLAVGRRIGAGFGVTTYVDSAAAPLPGFARARTFSFS